MKDIRKMLFLAGESKTGWKGQNLGIKGTHLKLRLGEISYGCVFMNFQQFCVLSNFMFNI